MSLLTALLLVLGACAGADDAAQPDRNGAALAAEPGAAAALTSNVQVVDQARAASPDAGLIPPGATVSAGSTRPGDVQIAYSSAQSPQRLRSWYRTAARAAGFRIDSELDEGAEHVLSGTSRGGRPFSVRLAPGDAGGTLALLLIGGG